MNCLEFRRLKLAEPRNASVRMHEHRLSCESCADFARRTDQFEIELSEAIAVPMPPNLADRVLLNHGLKRDFRTRMAIVAASIALLVGTTFSAGYYIYAPDPYLLDQSIKHVSGEPSALKAQQVVAQADMETALARSGAKLVADVSPIVSYLHDCPVPGGLGKHIVLQTPAGKITVITMPNRRVVRKGIMEAGGLVAAVMPAGKGSFAIVAPSRASLAAAEQTLQQYIRWRG